MTNTQTKSIPPGSEKKTTIQATLGESIQKISPPTTSFARVFLVNPSLLQAKGVVSKTLAERYSSRYAELRNTTDLACYSSKTLKDYYTTTAEEHSPKSSTPFKTWGIGGSTKFLTANIMGFHKTENGYSLSDILEKSVAPQYFLSQKAIAYLSRAEERGHQVTILPQLLKTTIKEYTPKAKPISNP